MDSKVIRSLGAGAVVAALSLLLPSQVQAQQRSGVEIWEANCGRCHILQPTNKYYPKDWRSVGTHMSITARLTTAQSEAVIAFLISGARTDATAALTPLPATPETAPLTQEQIAKLAEYVNGLVAASTPVVAANEQGEGIPSESR
jgi:mono/diheme cytochrome c family protein